MDGSGFVPSFLFGDQQHSTRKTFATPSKSNLSAIGSPGILRSRDSLTFSGLKSVRWSPSLVRARPKSPDSKISMGRTGTPQSASESLWNGPPLRSINEHINEAPLKHPRIDISCEGPSMDFINQDSMGYQDDQQIGQQNGSISGTSSTAAKDGASFISPEDLGYWVTVFGFPPESRLDTIELFSRHGDIMAQKVPKQGNWIHIRYSSTVHARQALTKNASLFNGFMIGVVPYKNNSLEDQVLHKQYQVQGNESLGPRLSLRNGTPLVPSISRNSTDLYSPNRSRLSVSSKTGMRPLNASAFADLDATDNSLNTSSFFRSLGTDQENSFFGKFWNMFS